MPRVEPSHLSAKSPGAMLLSYRILTVDVINESRYHKRSDQELRRHRYRTNLANGQNKGFSSGQCHEAKARNA